MWVRVPQQRVTLGAGLAQAVEQRHNLGVENPKTPRAKRQSSAALNESAAHDRVENPLGIRHAASTERCHGLNRPVLKTTRREIQGTLTPERTGPQIRRRPEHGRLVRFTGSSRDLRFKSGVRATIGSTNFTQNVTVKSEDMLSGEMPGGALLLLCLMKHPRVFNLNETERLNRSVVPETTGKRCLDSETRHQQIMMAECWTIRETCESGLKHTA